MSSGMGTSLPSLPSVSPLLPVGGEGRELLALAPCLPAAMLPWKIGMDSMSLELSALDTPVFYRLLWIGILSQWEITQQSPYE